MIESQLTTADINNFRAGLSDLYPGSQTDWSTQITEAWREVVLDIKDMGWNIRKLCKRYSLQASVTKTDVFDGAITTDEDNLQRLRLIINVTAIATTGTGKSVTFALEGTDDDGTTWVSINSSISVTATGDTTVQFTDCYKKYRLRITAFTTITTITYSAYLIETTFERLHLYKTLEIIYGVLRALKDDVYETDRQEWAQKYSDKLNTAQFAYDVDDDEEISTEESEMNNQDVVFRP